MVDHEERQILQKLEDDALENARKAAKEKGQQEADAAEEQAAIENPAGSDEVGLDEDTLTY